MKKVILDNWLSKIIRKRAYRLDFSKTMINEHDLPMKDSFIWTKVPVENISAIKNLQNLGFYVVDTNIQFLLKKKLIKFDTSNSSFVETKDETAVREIAGKSFIYNRFSLDPNIPNKLANKIKEEWAGNFFSGNRGKWMIVAKNKGDVVGFNQVLYKNKDTIIIDLIAVRKSFRGKNIAKSMISFASKECGNIPMNIEVGTQIANTGSMSLYTKLGFSVKEAFYILHMHN